MILHGIKLYQYGIALFLMVLHWYCMVLHGIARCCIVLYGIALYCIKSYGIALYCIVGFGARAVSRKTPIYFIRYVYILAVESEDGKLVQTFLLTFLTNVTRKSLQCLHSLVLCDSPLIWKNP